MLMREGAIVYHGPLIQLRSYLTGLGFLPPPERTQQQRDASNDASIAATVTADASNDPAAAASTFSSPKPLDLADWVVELLTFPERRHHKDLALLQGQGQELDGGTGAELSSTSNRPSPPVTTAALAAAWRAHPLFEALMAGAGGSAAAADAGGTPQSSAGETTVAMPSAPGPPHPIKLTTDFAREQYSRPYVHSQLLHARSVIGRQFKLMARNKFFIGEPYL